MARGRPLAKNGHRLPFCAGIFAFVPGELAFVVL